MKIISINVSIATFLFATAFPPPEITAQYLRKHNDTQAKNEDYNSFDASSIVEASNSDSSFDFYVLSMSFQPEFCYQHRRDSFPGCEKPQEFWRGSLTLHGLWPSYTDGSWPSSCTNEKFNPQTVDDLGPDRFQKLWPNVKSSTHGKELYGFWEHEWTKHGTCTGLSQDDYFDTAMKHFLPTPNLVREKYGSSVSATALLKAYHAEVSDAKDVLFVCSGGKYLSEVRVCVGRNKDGSGSQMIDCVSEIEEEGNCGNEIFIPEFYVDRQDNFASDKDVKVEFKKQ